MSSILFLCSRASLIRINNAQTDMQKLSAALFFPSEIFLQNFSETLLLPLLKPMQKISANIDGRFFFLQNILATDKWKNMSSMFFLKKVEP